MAASTILRFVFISEPQAAEPVCDIALHLIRVVLCIGPGNRKSLCNAAIGIGRGKAAVEARQPASRASECSQ